jgi:peptidoglycan hydrolase-like protein with peptidoglycan-binding domain
MQAIPADKYKEERDWQKWVVFDEGALDSIVLVVLWRLAAYARDVLKRPLHLIAGFRTYEMQLAAWNNWKYNGGPYANYPGTSWHEYHCAIDCHGPGTKWPEIVLASTKRPAMQSLAPYGLAVTNWLNNGNGVYEWWHIMSVETMNYTGAKKDFLLAGDKIFGEEATMKQGDYGPQVLSWQNSLVAEGSWAKGSATPPEPNSNFGPYTTTCTNIFKKKCGFAQDGIVDDATWGKMADALLALSAPVPQLEADLAEKTAEYDELKSRVDNYNAATRELLEV